MVTRLPEFKEMEKEFTFGEIRDVLHKIVNKEFEKNNIKIIKNLLCEEVR